MLKLVERLWHQATQPTDARAIEAVHAPAPLYRVSRGILDQIVYPLIDETNDLHVMRLNKLRKELEDSIGRYGFFDYCPVRDFMRAFGIPLTSETAQSMQLMQECHCIHFKDMPNGIYEKLPHLINHVLSCGQITHPLLNGGQVIDV